MHRFQFIRALGAIALTSLVPLAGFASEQGTRAEAITMVTDAVAHVKKAGPQQAFDDFTNNKAKWINKDLYVFVIDTDAGNLTAHGANPKLIGRNLVELKDQNGKLFFREFIDVAKSSKGEGWVDYDWSNPTTKKVEPKSTLVRRVPGTAFAVAVGIYR
jgi:signal transduction histidine kinase